MVAVARGAVNSRVLLYILSCGAAAELSISLEPPEYPLSFNSHFKIRSCLFWYLEPMVPLKKEDHTQAPQGQGQRAPATKHKGTHTSP